MGVTVRTNADGFFATVSGGAGRASLDPLLGDSLTLG
jgi:hypothetical protein